MRYWFMWFRFMGFGIYLPFHDWAGLGFRHWMIAWTDFRGFPRSFCWAA